MKATVYFISAAISKILGSWFFNLISKIIATGYFIFRPRQVGNSVDFYRTLFPEKRLLYHLWCSWKQYMSFTRVFLDRFKLIESGKITHTSNSWEILEEAVERKEGGIILMSHVGNWEIAAHRFKETDSSIDLLLYLGVKHKEQIEKLQKRNLMQKGTKIVAVEKDNSSSPFLLLESIKWMNDGGFVSLTGDVVWNKEQKAVQVDFFGRKATLPEAPYMMAMLSGKPIFVLISVPVRKNHYRIEISDPIYVTAKSRKERQGAIENACQQYATILENVIKKHPFEWFHFEPFFVDSKAENQNQQ